MHENELILEPYSVMQQWDIPRAAGHWDEFLSTYLQTVAQRCTDGHKAVVGHIKILALLENDTYLRVSVIAPNRPAAVEREGNPPDDLPHLKTTLNVLVYGRTREDIQHIAEEEAAALAAQWGGQVQNSYPHPHHHSHSEH